MDIGNVRLFNALLGMSSRETRVIFRHVSVLQKKLREAPLINDEISENKSINLLCSYCDFLFA